MSVLGERSAVRLGADEQVLNRGPGWLAGMTEMPAGTSPDEMRRGVRMGRETVGRTVRHAVRLAERS